MHLSSNLDLTEKRHSNLRWKFHRKSWREATRRRILDFNGSFLFEINNLYESGFGSGFFISKRDFLRGVKP
jgi:hypothetical protein